MAIPSQSDIHGINQYQNTASSSPKNLSGGDNNYYVVEVSKPKRNKPYVAECEDIIESLNMSFQEGAAFKAIWRKASARSGNGKPNDDALRNAEQVAHYGKRMVAIESGKQ